jgi:hypothetical protein
MRTYPRLLITRRSVSVLVAIGAGHRGYELRRFWTVQWVSDEGEETLMYLGRDDSVIGWVDCVDFAHATVRAARHTA